MCKRTQAGLSAACVELENVAEAVSSAAVDAAGVRAPLVPHWSCAVSEACSAPPMHSPAVCRSCLCSCCAHFRAAKGSSIM